MTENKVDKKLIETKNKENTTRIPRKDTLLMTEKQLRKNEWLTDREIEAFLFKNEKLFRLE
jgi:hypothetical protein